MQRFCPPSRLGKVIHSTQRQEKDLVQDHRYRPKCVRMMNTVRKKTDTVLKWMNAGLAAGLFFCLFVSQEDCNFVCNF